jgi:hypothetical protein
MAAGFSGSSSPRCDFWQKNALRSLALLLLLLTLVVVAEIGLTHRNAYEATQAHERDRVQHDLADMRLTVSGYLGKIDARCTVDVPLDRAGPVFERPHT